VLRTQLKKAFVNVGDRGRRFQSMIKGYEPMAQGKKLLDAQYAAAEWAYLRSIGEIPRFGVVSAYCSLLASEGSLLEIGCGEGILVEHLDRNRFARFTGVDISSVAIDRARALADDRTTFLCADAESLVPDDYYDLIIFNEVLEYFDDPLAVVRRYERFVKPNGHFVVSMFDPVQTVRTRRIWKLLGGRYATVAHAKVSTARNFTWNVKVLRPPTSAGS
jgi:2-polyprenyl-3-methyl-5-hydroxy-6-metoxy-1,4-benzoquinol methylase